MLLSPPSLQGTGGRKWGLNNSRDKDREIAYQLPQQAKQTQHGEINVIYCIQMELWPLSLWEHFLLFASAKTKLFLPEWYKIRGKKNKGYLRTSGSDPIHFPVPRSYGSVNIISGRCYSNLSWIFSNVWGTTVSQTSILALY